MPAGNIQGQSVYVQSEYFDLITTGRKTVEGRLNRYNIKQFKTGDYFCFRSTHHRRQWVRIIARHEFPTFQAMLTKLKLEACLPNCESIAIGVKVYNAFTGYKAHQEKGYSDAVVGFEIQCVPYPPAPPAPSPAPTVPVTQSTG